MLRNEGSSTLGESDKVLLVGPSAPATKRGLSGVRSEYSSASSRASRAAETFISRASALRP